MKSILTSFSHFRYLTWAGFIFLLLHLSAPDTHAQYIDSQEELKSMTFSQRIYYGGIVGAGFGYITSVQALPVVGYRINHRWSAGVGANYQYFRVNDTPSFDAHTIGGNLHTRVFILEMLFAHSEFEILNLEPTNPNSAEFGGKRITIPAWFVGVGYYMRFGNKSGVAITFLYDLIQDLNSPYRPANYTLRMGIIF